MKELKKILNEVKKRGWYLHRERKHYIFRHEKGGIVTVSKTNSEYRALNEIRKDFIRQETINNH